MMMMMMMMKLLGLHGRPKSSVAVVVVVVVVVGEDRRGELILRYCSQKCKLPAPHTTRPTGAQLEESIRFPVDRAEEGRAQQRTNLNHLGLT